MARKGWDALTDAYRDRLLRGGISQAAYESGSPLTRARGHTNPRLESFRRQARQFAETHSERTYQPERADQMRHYILHLGVNDGRDYMRDAREMVRLYERGDTDAARALWDQRNQSVPEWMNYYHGIFSF